MVTRRNFLSATGGGIGIAIAGCLDRGVDLASVSLRTPDPVGIETGDENTGGALHQYFVRIENTGIDGDVEITLVFRDENESIWSPTAERIGSKERFFSNGERRTVEFTAESPQSVQPFGFRLLPGEAEVEVQNDGETGEVEVRIFQQNLPDDTVAKKTVSIPGDSTEVVSFGDLSIISLVITEGGVDLGVNASPVE